MPSTASKTAGRLVVSQAARMCFGVAGCALIAALIAAVVSQYLSGWMGVGGMVTIALLYLGLGLSELRWEQTSFCDDSATDDPRDPVEAAPQPHDAKPNASKSTQWTAATTPDRGSDFDSTRRTRGGAAR